MLLVPGLRPVDGYDPLIDVGLNQVVDAAVIAVLLVRCRVERRGRAAWLLMAAGLSAAFGASVASSTWFQHLDPVPSSSLSDVGWLAFYALLYAGLLQLLRPRVRRMLRSVWLDRPSAEDAAHGGGSPGDADDEVALQAAAEQRREVGRDVALEQVAGAARRDHG